MDKRVYLLMAIAFGVGMVELIIGGILDLVAIDLNITEGQAGLLITFFALTFALSGPILLYMTRHINRKAITLFALLVFFISHLMVIFSTTYAMVLLSRILSAASGGLLVVLCLILAAHISSEQYRGRAIGLVVMGISGSVVLGLPLGVGLGHSFGWRSPFILVAILTIVLAIFVMLFFGNVVLKESLTLRDQVRTLKNRRVFFGHMTTFLFLAGHFTLYGYLTPFVQETFGYTGTLITLVYFLYGLAAVTGGGFAGIMADRFGARQTLLVTIILLAVSLFVIPLSTEIVFWFVLIIWGGLSWAITPPMQTHLIQIARRSADIQQSLNNTALHLGIAFGTFVGSIVIDNFSVIINPFVGIVFIILSFASANISLKTSQIAAEQS